MSHSLSERQLEFLLNSTRKINLTYGAVRSGKTMGITFRFMQAVAECPDSQIYMIGHTASTIYDNVVRLILEAPEKGVPDPLGIFRPFCKWLKGDRELLFKDKTISTVGAKDGGAIGAIQGKTMSIAYCDEMTLYPDPIIDMISTRLSNPHSVLFASMNPSYPTHKLKQWIDRAEAGDPDYYALKFTLDDNPYVDLDYKHRVKNSLSGVFYKRNYLGEWCLAEGAIFDFFDRAVHVIKKPPRAADYWVVGVDYGTNNAFAAVLVGVYSGQYDQTPSVMWVEKEYYWDHKKTGLQKTSSEFARELKSWIQDYAVKSIYIDPSAASFRVDMQRLGLHPVNADNDVLCGINKTSSLMKDGRLFVCSQCTNLIREVESYVWDPKSCESGEDEPMKKDDHAIDALRYVINTHKVPSFDQADYWKKQKDEWKKSQWRHPNDFGFR